MWRTKPDTDTDKRQHRRRHSYFTRQLTLHAFLLLSNCFLLIFSFRLCVAFVAKSDNNNHADAGESMDVDDYDHDFFPPLIEADDLSYFFSTYDIDGLHWALTNIFNRSARNPNNNLPGKKKVELPQALVARGGGDTYTSEYKLRHDMDQARYLVEQLRDSDPQISEYFASQVIPIYERVLQNIPPLMELQRTRGLYAFTKDDYAAGIGSVYNKALYMATADELYPGWKQHDLLNNALDWEGIQRDWFGESAVTQTESTPRTKKEATATPSESETFGVIVIDDLLTPRTLSLIRQLLLRNTHWFQTKTPLEFGKYVGSYVDDGLHDPLFLELAKQLHQAMPRIMKGHDLMYMWAYKYDSEFESGINLHADQAAVNVNMWISMEEADLEEEGYGGGLVVFTAKPPSNWDFEAYNTNTEFVVEELLRPNDFANVTIKHRPNRAVIFDSALFHQTDRYRFKRGYENGRINLTLLFGEMRKGDGGSSAASSGGSVKQEL